MKRALPNALAGFILALPLAAHAGTFFERDLFYGVQNDADVTRLQQFLSDQDVYTGPVTGNFLTLTRAGVRAFQRREGITPVAGYFGPKTRARTNALLAQTETLVKSPPVPLPALPPDTTPPRFVKAPHVGQARFLAIPPPLGARYAYGLTLDWSVNEAGSLEETVICAPPLKAGQVIGRFTEYYPEPATTYACTIIVKDQAGNASQGKVTFASPPSWTGVGGEGKLAFPTTTENSIKLGDISVFNGTPMQIIFSSLVVNILDAMDTPANRGREATLVLRRGTNASDDVLSRTPFRFSASAPTSTPNRAEVALPYPVSYAPGDERSFGLWIENLGKVISGSLTVEFAQAVTQSGVPTAGTFSFILKK